MNNLLIHWKLDSQRSGKFASAAIETSRPYATGRLLPEMTILMARWNMLQLSQKMFINGLKNRRDSNAETGEWIVFAKYKGENYYLTLGLHTENDQEIYQRVASCKAEFPFLQ